MPADSLSWSRFYAECRSEMEFRYGLKRIPKDYYKEMFPDEATIHDVALAVRANPRIKRVGHLN